MKRPLLSSFFTSPSALLAVLLVGAGLATAALSLPAMAMGDDDDTTPTCPKGQVYDEHKKECVEQQSSLLPDENLAHYAYSLAKAGRYEEALDVLDTLKDPNTAEALNYRGYATRKLGRTDEGISYYLKSVALDPHYAKVREYLGEAYVIKGRDDLAREQLGTIKTLCGTGCEEYQDLAAAIANPASL
jgi:Flp pilus assembly protein TadD